ncbi:MAG: type IV pilus twitching motility protein PilT [Deltaproteobacteria bacterium]
MPADIHFLLKKAISKSASDLHLVPGLPPIMRVNGTLEKVGEDRLDQASIESMVREVVPPSIVLTPGQDRDVAIEAGSMARFRLNIYVDRSGTCAAFRLIPKNMYSLQALGVPDVVSKVAQMRRGLVLVTGVTGSGKSTTIASLLDMINETRSDHIITIEDPIEYVHPHKKCVVNQREVGTHVASFAEALRAALREDPDIILVGELRDLETISMAMTAAETGHLVLSSLHTRGAAQTIDRIIDVFPAYQQEQVRIQLADTLEMVVSQVLLPSMDGTRRYLGCEVMLASTGIRQLIRAKKTHQIPIEIQTHGEEGMITMEKSLKRLIDTGKISKEMALPWVGDKKLFEMHGLQGF